MARPDIRHWIPNYRETIAEMYAKGLSMDKIGELTGTIKGTVRDHLVAQGIQPRPRGGANRKGVRQCT